MTRARSADRLRRGPFWVSYKNREERFVALNGIDITTEVVPRVAWSSTTAGSWVASAAAGARSTVEDYFLAPCGQARRTFDNCCDRRLDEVVEVFSVPSDVLERVWGWLANDNVDFIAAFRLIARDEGICALECLRLGKTKRTSVAIEYQDPEHFPLDLYSWEARRPGR